MKQLPAPTSTNTVRALTYGYYELHSYPIPMATINRIRLSCLASLSSTCCSPMLLIKGSVLASAVEFSLDE